MRTASLIIASLAISAAANAAPINLVQNGSFETVNVTPNHQVVGTDDLPGWTLDTSIYKYDDVYNSRAALDYTVSYDGGGGPGPDDRRLAAAFTGVVPNGQYFFGADGDRTYGSPLSQTINGLVVGQKYNVTFYLGFSQLRNRTGDTTNRWAVSLGGDTQYTPLVNVPAQSFTGWSQTTLTYTATATSEVLEFFADGGPAGLPPFALLDGVSLTAAQTPEPAMLALLGLGVAGFAAARSRRC